LRESPTTAYQKQKQKEKVVVFFLFLEHIRCIKVRYKLVIMVSAYLYVHNLHNINYGP